MTVPLGPQDVPVTVPAGWHATLALPRPATALADLDTAIAAAIENPVAGRPLEVLAAERVALARAVGHLPTATVVVTDATRDCPDDRFLPPLLRAIERGGIAPADTTILVATGMHRASTPEEKRAKLGGVIAERYRVVDHDARDPGSIADLGETASGVPATVSRMAFEADLLVATGIVEPHQYAGWSGGAKTVAIGVAGEATIAATHATAFIDRPGVRLARLAGNPFHEAVVDLGRRAGLAFVINVVLDANGRAVHVAAGEPDAVHELLAEIAGPETTVPIRRQADIAIAGVGAPKDANLYQATRAVTYLHFAPVPAVRTGGVYVLPATIPEGAGQGVGERRFFGALAAAAIEPDGFARLVGRMRRAGGLPGEQRAYLVARVLAEASIIVVGADDPAVPRAVGMHAASTLDAAFDLAAGLLGGGETAAGPRRIDLLVVPHAIRTLPIVEGLTLSPAPFRFGRTP